MTEASEPSSPSRAETGAPFVSLGGRLPGVMVVVGTRPEAIKMAPVVRALRRKGGRTRVHLLLTGQHTDLVSDALRTFRLSPDLDLAIMQEAQTLYDVASGCLTGVRDAVDRWDPSMVLVQGDTATVFFSALAGYFEGVATAHVEAGLRSGDLRSPFPEEGFRRLTGVLADLHFAPTPRARENLLAEGVPPDRIHVTGNTVVDALLQITRETGMAEDPRLARILNDAVPFALLTAHRREAWGEPLKRIFQGVKQLVDLEPDLHILYPVHPNPRIRGPAEEHLGGHPRIHLVDPLRYEDLALALQAARLVLTDSGGIQEEAPTFGTPLLVLRDVTERPEGIEAGVAELVGTDPHALVQGARRAFAGSSVGRTQRQLNNPYGDGRAALRIAAALEAFLLGSPSSDLELLLRKEPEEASP
jgi:UDP-N-acetylglucosamine 2-epimerase (non-hydrolysing)